MLEVGSHNQASNKAVPDGRSCTACSLFAMSGASSSICCRLMIAASWNQHSNDHHPCTAIDKIKLPIQSRLGCYKCHRWLIHIFHLTTNRFYISRCWPWCWAKFILSAVRLFLIIISFLLYAVHCLIDAQNFHCFSIGQRDDKVRNWVAFGKSSQTLTLLFAKRPVCCVRISDVWRACNHVTPLIWNYVCCVHACSNSCAWLVSDMFWWHCRWPHAVVYACPMMFAVRAFCVSNLSITVGWSCTELWRSATATQSGALLESKSTCMHCLWCNACTYIHALPLR